MNTAVKFAAGSSDVLQILAIPFGGPLNGRDTDGEYFSAKTDLCLDWFPEQRPLLYGHGLDPAIGVQVVGRVDATSATKEVDGVWVQAQLDKQSAYYDSIKALLAKGSLYASSGAMPHLVTRSKSGEITRWPWTELSLTPTPANLFATVQPADAVKHYEPLGLGDAFKATLDAAARNSLDDSDFAYIDSKGGRHLPIHDAAHVRAAISRFSQTTFASADDKAAAAKKILSAAKKFGIEVADDSTVAEAAKSAKALPDGAIPAVGYGGDAPEGSAEDWIEDLTEALNPLMASGYVSVLATFGINGPGYAVVRQCTYDYDDGDPSETYYRVDYTMGPDGEPVIGSLSPLTPAYVAGTIGTDDASEPLKTCALITAIDYAYKTSRAVEARTKDVLARRAKEGRMLSSANVARLQALRTSLTKAAQDLDTLLGKASPQAKAADSALLRQLELRTRALQIRTATWN